MTRPSPTVESGEAKATTPGTPDTAGRPSSESPKIWQRIPQKSEANHPNALPQIAWIQVGDARGQSLAQLRDNVFPGTDPDAARIEDFTGRTKFIVLPRLRSGALVVSSNRVDVVRAAADAIERADR